VNLAQIQAECGRLLNDPNNTRWTPDILTIRANLAQTEITGYTQCIRSVELLTTTASTRSIPVNDATMGIVRAFIVDSGGARKPFTGITIEELDFRYPDWNQWEDGAPILWLYDASNQQIQLFPRPDAANSFANAIGVYEIRDPAALSNPTDIPFDSIVAMTPYHISICHWVVAQCWMDDGTPEALAKARFHKSGSMLHPGEYEKQLGRIMAEFDSPDIIQSQVLWKPEGGRAGGWGFPSKSNPLPW